MYKIDTDTYVCDYCGVEFVWNVHNEDHGDVWECEDCGRHFCTNCFVSALGRDAFDTMTRESDKVLCPGCFEISGVINEQEEE